MQCLQLFCQEEFIRRITLSRYKESFILKGGLLIYALSNFESRTTRDADFLVERLSNSIEDMKNVINEIINTTSKNDFVNFELISLKEIAIEKKYKGVSASMVVKIKNTRTGINIDFGFGDTIVPEPDKRTFPTQVKGFNAPEIRCYPIETIIAEKIDAILDRMELTSRMKDYFDIFFIQQNFNFNGKILVEAIRKSFENRHRDFNNERFQRIIQLQDDSAMNTKWQAFLRKSKLSNVDFPKVIEDMQNFLQLPLNAVFSKTDFNLAWNHEVKEWSRP